MGAETAAGVGVSVMTCGCTVGRYVMTGTRSYDGGRSGVFEEGSGDRETGSACADGGDDGGGVAGGAQFITVSRTNTNNYDIKILWIILL